MTIHITDNIERDQLPEECIDDCGGGGRKDEAVEYWRNKLGLTVDRNAAIRCLRSTGAWDVDELNASTDEQLADLILWIACSDFAEQEDETLFYLGE